MKFLDALGYDEVVFPKLGLDFKMDETAFTLFGLEIKWYGLLITVGMMLAMAYCFSQMKKFGVDPDRAIDCVVGGVIGGLVGARAYYVIMSWDTYKDDLGSVFNIRGGGLAIYGGIIGAVLAGVIIARIKKVKILPLLDIASIGFLLGQGIGRWGNFTNQEAFGCNTDSIFGMSSGKIQLWIVDHQDTATLSAGQTLNVTQPVHPCFLYESVWCLLGFVLLVIFAKKIRKYDGQILLIYLAWYGLERFFVEGLRTDSLMLGNLRVSQVLAAVCVIASVILQIVIGLKVKRMGTDYVMYVNTEEFKQRLIESEEKKNGKKEKDELSEQQADEGDVPEEKDQKDDSEAGVAGSGEEGAEEGGEEAREEGSGSLEGHGQDEEERD